MESVRVTAIFNQSFLPVGPALDRKILYIPSLCQGSSPSSYGASQEVRPSLALGILQRWVMGKGSWGTEGYYCAWSSDSGKRKDATLIVLPSLTRLKKRTYPACLFTQCPLVVPSSLTSPGKSQSTESPKWPHGGGAQAQPPNQSFQTQLPTARILCPTACWTVALYHKYRSENVLGQGICILHW